MLERLKKNQFLFEELVKRDFKIKYKGTWLGVVWSVLQPLLMFLVMRTIFLEFFGRTMEHYTIYLLSGYIVFNYFSDSTKSTMKVLRYNAKIIEKVNVPKYLFVLSRNAQGFISYLLILAVYFIFVAIDGIAFTWKFVLLLFPVIFQLLFNIGMGFILSALYTFFRDFGYLYDVIVKFVSYMSAVFYDVERFSPAVQSGFFMNPVYCFIYYFRCVTLYDTVPPLWLHLLIFCYTLLALTAGCTIYRKYNTRFLYYM